MSPRILLVAALAAMVSVAALNAQNNAASGRRTAAQGAAAEADAEESARLQARRYQIWAARLDSGLTDADRVELEEIARAVRVIEVKYQAPGMLELSVDVRNRTRERVVALAGPAWNRLLLERFPAPDRVRRDYTDPVRAAAALEVLYYEFALGRTLRPPRTAEMDARDAAYRAAIQEIFLARVPGGESSPAWATLAESHMRLASSAAFKREVLGRYVPLLASWVRDDPTPLSVPMPQSAALDAFLFRPVGTFGGQPLLLGHIGVPIIAVLALLGGVIIPFRRARRAGRRHNAGRAPGTGSAERLLDLPVELQVLDLPGGMYPELTVTSGVVMEKEGWTETTTTYGSTAPSPHHGGSTTVSTTTTKKDRLWVRTTSGDEQPWTVTGDVFPARPGHPVTWVAARLRQDPQTPCMVFNHATGHHYEKPWIALAHRGAFGTFLLALLWIALCGAVAAWLEWRMFQTTYLVQAPPIIVVPALAVWVPIARALVHRPRQRAWKTRYRPRLLDWLKAVGPAIPGAVAGEPLSVKRAP